MSMVAHLSTPDTLCIAFSLAGYCLLIYQRSFTGFAACFLLAQMARPDTLLLSSALAVFFTLCINAPYRLTLRQGLGFVVATAILYVTVNSLTGNYGWKVAVYYSFINKSAYPADVLPVFGWEQYVGIVRNGIVRIAANGRLQMLLVASLIASVCHCLCRPDNRLFIGIVWVAWLVLALRFVLFPAWWEDRYYYPYYFIVLFALAEAVPACFRQLFAHAIKRRAYHREPVTI